MSGRGQLRLPQPACRRVTLFRLSGRTMARSGLRMIPTFPSSPLRFRTAGFPRYGSKAGLSGRAFPDLASVSCSQHTRRVDQVCLRPSCSPRQSLSPALSRRSSARWNTAMRATNVALLQGPSLQCGLCCPAPSTLNRPHPPHSWAQHNFIALRFIWAAFAVRERLGDPRVVPGFRCTFLPGMPSPKTPRSSTSVSSRACPLPSGSGPAIIGGANNPLSDR
jgi:hypothetical protein